MFYITQYVYINRTLELSFQLNKNLLITLVIKKKNDYGGGKGESIKKFSNYHLIFTLVSSLDSARWPDYTGANIPGDWYHIGYNCIFNNRQGSYTKVS